MNRVDIFIPAMLIGVVIFSGVFFLTEWQAEMSEEAAMEKMAEKLDTLDPNLTNCQELATALDNNRSVIMESALKKKIMEMEC